MKLKETFRKVPELYNSVRLTYPTRLFSEIKKYQPLVRSSALLEIGIGTGKATEPFAKLGCPITAIDLSPELIVIAKKNLKKYKKIKYIAKPFEAVTLPKNKFDFAYAGQTFHWINLQKGFKKIHDSLKQGGSLAFFWNLHDPKKPGVGRDTKNIFKKYRMFRQARMSNAGVINHAKKSKYFTDVTYIEIPWIAIYTKQQRINLLNTYSAVITLSPARKERFFNDIQKSLDKYSSPLHIPITTKLIMARKK